MVPRDLTLVTSPNLDSPRSSEDEDSITSSQGDEAERGLEETLEKLGFGESRDEGTVAVHGRVASQHTHFVTPSCTRCASLGRSSSSAEAGCLVTCGPPRRCWHVVFRPLRPALLTIRLNVLTRSFFCPQPRRPPSNHIPVHSLHTLPLLAALFVLDLVPAVPPAGAYQWRLFALCGCGWMSDNSALACIAVILPRVQVHWNLGSEVVGVLSASTMAGVSLLNS